MEIKRAYKDDVERVVDLINTEDESLITVEQFTNWYFNNHSQSQGLIIVEENNKVEGLCSTNHFKFNLMGEDTLIAFPMKVLTSPKIRGKGMFSKLYWKNQEVCFKDEGVDFFINFPNAVSSPIFLAKFEYLEGVCSDLAFMPSKLLGTSASRYTSISTLPKTFFNEAVLTKINGFTKDYSYFHWRYETAVSTETDKYEFISLDNQGGIAILKQDTKKGLPIYLLLDVIVKDQSQIADVMDSARRYAGRRLKCGVLSFIHDYNRNYISPLKLKKVFTKPFNFSVKGKTPDETQKLTQVNFNFELGDLDFL